MPADLKRLHKYMLEIEHIDSLSDEMRAGRGDMARAGIQVAAQKDNLSGQFGVMCRFRDTLQSMSWHTLIEWGLHRLSLVARIARDHARCPWTSV
jgi:hypothetical protein